MSEHKTPVLSLGVLEAAEATRIGRDAMYALVNSGQIPSTAVPDTTKRVISVDLLRAWLIINAKGENLEALLAYLQRAR